MLQRETSSQFLTRQHVFTIRPSSTVCFTKFARRSLSLCSTVWSDLSLDPRRPNTDNSKCRVKTHLLIRPVYTY